MPMIYCSECESEASPKAPFCPKCGHPLQASTGQAHGKQDGTVVTTQRTHKALKVRMLLATLVLVFGMLVSCFAYFASGNMSVFIRIVGQIIALVGVVAMIVVKVSIWWHHE